MKKLLIGLTGRTGSNEIAGCGKDTVADIICKYLSIKSYGFADPIYDMVKAGFGIDGKSKEWQDRAKKSAPIEWLSAEKDTSLRCLLETLGTEWGRNMICSDLWTRIAEKRYYESEAGLIIRDVRFENEVDWLDRLGGVLVHIIRPNHFNVEANPNHPSNIPLGIRNCDKVIMNDGSLEELRDRVLKFISDIL